VNTDDKFKIIKQLLAEGYKGSITEYIAQIEQQEAEAMNAQAQSAQQGQNPNTPTPALAGNIPQQPQQSATERNIIQPGQYKSGGIKLNTRMDAGCKECGGFHKDGGVKDEEIGDTIKVNTNTGQHLNMEIQKSYEQRRGRYSPSFINDPEHYKQWKQEQEESDVRFAQKGGVRKYPGGGFNFGGSNDYSTPKTSTNIATKINKKGIYSKSNDYSNTKTSTTPTKGIYNKSFDYSEEGIQERRDNNPYKDLSLSEKLDLGLTTAGMAPGLGIIPDAINTVSNLGQGAYHSLTGDTEQAATDYENAAWAAGGMIPIAGQSIAGTKLAKKAIQVYRGGKNAVIKGVTGRIPALTADGTKYVNPNTVQKVFRSEDAATVNMKNMDYETGNWVSANKADQLFYLNKTKQVGTSGDVMLADDKARRLMEINVDKNLWNKMSNANMPQNAKTMSGGANVDYFAGEGIFPPHLMENIRNTEGIGDFSTTHMFKNKADAISKLSTLKKGGVRKYDNGGEKTEGGPTKEFIANAPIYDSGGQCWSNCGQRNYDSKHNVSLGSQMTVGKNNTGNYTGSFKGTLGYEFNPRGGSGGIVGYTGANYGLRSNEVGDNNVEFKKEGSLVGSLGYKGEIGDTKSYRRRGNPLHWGAGAYVDKSITGGGTTYGGYGQLGNFNISAGYNKNTGSEFKLGIGLPIRKKGGPRHPWGFDDDDNNSTYTHIPMDSLIKRQQFNESRFKSDAVSPDGATSIAQIMPKTFKDGLKKGYVPEGTKYEDLAANDALATQFQTAYMNDLLTRSWNKGNDKVKRAKALAAYNMGPTGLVNYLNAQKKKGVDIYKSLDWVDELNKETKNYVNNIMLGGDEKYEKEFNTEHDKKFKSKKELKKGGVRKYHEGGAGNVPFDDPQGGDNHMQLPHHTGGGETDMYGPNSDNPTGPPMEWGAGWNMGGSPGLGIKTPYGSFGMDNPSTWQEGLGMVATGGLNMLPGVKNLKAKGLGKLKNLALGVSDKLGGLFKEGGVRKYREGGPHEEFINTNYKEDKSKSTLENKEITQDPNILEPVESIMIPSLIDSDLAVAVADNTLYVPPISIILEADEDAEQIQQEQEALIDTDEVKSNTEITVRRNKNRDKKTQEVIKKETQATLEAFYNQYQKIDYDEMSIKQVQGMQQILVDAGYDIGKYGPNKDGIDGKFGNKTRLAYLDYMQSKLNTNTSITFDPSGRDEKCDETGCAQYVTNEFTREGYDVNAMDIGGDAWTMYDQIITRGGGTSKYNIFNNPEFQNVNSSQESKRKSINAVKNGNVEKDMLQEGDVVGLVYNNSTNWDNSYNDVSDGTHFYGDKIKNKTYNSHVGFVSGFDQNGNPIISHNVDGKVYNDVYTNIHGGGIAWIATPNSASNTGTRKYDYAENITEHDNSETLTFFDKKNFEGVVDENGTQITYSDQDKDIQNNAINFIKNNTPIILDELEIPINGDDGEDWFIEAVIGIGMVESGLGVNTPDPEEIKTKRNLVNLSPFSNVSTDVNDFSLGVTKTKLNSIGGGTKSYYNINSNNITTDPTKSLAVTIDNLARNYQLLQEYSAANPQLELNEEDIRNMTILSHNRGLLSRNSAGGGTGTNFGGRDDMTIAEQVESLRTLYEGNMRDVSSTNYRFLPDFIADPLYTREFGEEGSETYVSKVNRYINKQAQTHSQLALEEKEKQKDITMLTNPNKEHSPFAKMGGYRSKYGW
jgi:hypothetical protein